jgi:ribosomal protein L22
VHCRVTQAVPGAIENPLSAAVPKAAGPPRERVAHAKLRNARISPQKLNDVVRIIRRLQVDEALVQCQMSVKKAAKLIYKVLS